MFKLFINKSKSPFAKNKLFDVDLAGFEPASLVLVPPLYSRQI